MNREEYRNKINEIESDFLSGKIDSEEYKRRTNKMVYALGEKSE